MKKVIMFPGQGSQYKGMGQEVFTSYKKEVDRASQILGYDLEELCLKDPNRVLSKTQFTQPALFVVNALTCYQKYNTQSADYLIGHSLGEYNALHAGGAFDFETGVKLVQKRGQLMAEASGGGMAAVLGLNAETLKLKLEHGGYHQIDVANFNTPTQIVISGPQQIISSLIKDFDNQNIKVIPLFVTAPFHSRYMKDASETFASFLKNFSFSPLKIPVIANSTALPYQETQMVTLLSNQISQPVRWTDSIRVLMGENVTTYQEVTSTILTKMVEEIKSSCTPIVKSNETQSIKKSDDHQKIKTPPPIDHTSQNQINQDIKLLSTRLGSSAFRNAYGIKYAYLTGAMYRGIASKELVVLMGKAQMMGFLGTGGLTINEIEANIKYIQGALSKGESYGLNLLHNLVDPQEEMNTVELYLKHGIRNVEAAAFMQLTLPLVYYRLKGFRKDDNGDLVCDHKIVAKVSRPEVAEAFMKPAPERMINRLLDDGLITEQQANLAKNAPISHDICVEADSGGHTDGGVALVLLPAIQRLREDIQKQNNYQEIIRIGLAGGIGTPQAVACAFVMGADFVLTGSINQCTVEAGISDAVKDLLQDINVQDTEYAPAGDMFEIGAKVQVLKKGVLFPARANKLYALYKQFETLEDIPEKTIAQLEKSYFKDSIENIWKTTKDYFIAKGQQKVIQEAMANPKKKMALVFRWYFGYSGKLSFQGDIKEKVNFQVHTGPSLGAFNQWTKGTPLENWRNRHADTIGIKIMEEAAQILETKAYSS